MRILNLIWVMAALILGMSTAVEAQVVRSQTHRASHRAYRSPHVYRHHHYRPYYRHQVYPRYGFQVNIGYGTGYYGVGGYYNFYTPQHGPRFIHYPARCPAPCLPAPVVIQQQPVQVAPAQEITTVGLKPGEVRQIGEVVIANIDGKIVILQAEPANGE